MSNVARAETEDLDQFIIGEEQGRALFDATARRLLGISGDEFRRRWHAGEYSGADTNDVISLVMMLPMVERIAVSDQP